jgi:hypothetical protein
MAGQPISAKLLHALGKVDRPGSFYAEGSASVVLPGMMVDGVGAIGVPLTVEQAQEIKKQCEQAPYGKGEQTLVDTKVRRVWHLTPDRFELTNPEWPGFIAQVVQTVQEQLGLEKQKLQAHLYDLLLYEKGSFFLPHRDGEKEDRMVATMVVALPSPYQGGELVIRHEGQEHTIDLGSAEGRSFQIHFAAFYADCEHEVRPLLQGYRLCLVYNLTLARGKKTIPAPPSVQHVATVRDLLRDWQTETAEDAPRKLAVLLEHQYTQDGLTWDALKGVDRTRAQVLRLAARQAGCKASLAQLTFWESGLAADDGSGDYYGSRRWYDYDNYEEEEDEDKEDEDEENFGDHEMEEVYDSSLTAEHWTDDEGQRLALGKMLVESEEVVPEDVLRNVKPEEDYEGYTGNEGMTLERWYRHAAIFLWPEKRHFEVLASGTENPSAALGLLVKKWRKAGRKQQAELKAQCVDFARHILAHWRPQPTHRFYEQETERSELVPALTVLDEPALVEDFLRGVMTQDASIEATAALLKVCDKHGWMAFRDALASVFQTTTAESLPRNVHLLEQLCTGRWKRKPDWQTLCSKLAPEMLTALETIDRKTDDWRTVRPDRAAVLADLVRALLAAGLEKPLARLLAHVAATPKRYPLREVQIPALLALSSWLGKHLEQPSPALSGWLADCREQLEALTAAKPEPPTDFRREAKVACQCADCRELVAFLKDPQEKVHRFSVAKPRRRHLHSMIEHHHCDLTHVTDRRGSPQTLVCTKTTASFEGRLRQYKADQEHLATLRALAKRLRS